MTVGNTEATCDFEWEGFRGEAHSCIEAPGHDGPHHCPCGMWVTEVITP